MRKYQVKLKLLASRCLLAVMTLVYASGCQMSPCNLSTTISSPITPCCAQFPSAFAPLTLEERQQEWAKELMIAETFAREFDLYRAITGYKRAIILLSEANESRAQQSYYSMIFCYYLGKKYVEAIAAFESSPLTKAGPNFPAYSQLLLMMYDCYFQAKNFERAADILQKIQKFSPETASELEIYEEIVQCRPQEAEIKMAEHLNGCEMQADLGAYFAYKKSPSKARFLNAILPVGQPRSALTSFIINSLFILASYECFKHGYPAAGLITASLETGWYFGGINGAGLEAQEFNNRLYEGVATKVLKKNYCFPFLMFETSF